MTLPDDRVVSYDRDALSRVTAKRIDGVKVKGWIYKDALKPIAETDADGNVVSFFVYGTSGLSPDYMIRDGITYRFIRDVQGNVRLVVDSATGTIVQRLDYDSFGNVLTDTNPGFQPFGFQSGLYDPDTALVQFGARWYDAASGRWLSKDPILLEGGLNLYVFCSNDPVNFADPLGLCEDESVWEAAGIGFMEGLSRGAQGVVNAFTGGLFVPEAGLFYDSFNEQWDDLGDDTNEDNEQFNAGMTGGRVGEAFLLAAGAASLTSIGNATMGWRGGEITFTRPGAQTPDWRINPLGGSGHSPHYHRRGPGGIGRHRPWQSGPGGRLGRF